MIALDEKQQLIIDNITAYRKEHGQSPSLHELADLTGIPYSTLRNDIAVMSKRGLLVQVPGRVRSITVPDEPKYSLPDLPQDMALEFLDIAILLGTLAGHVKEKLLKLHAENMKRKEQGCAHDSAD